MDTATLAKWVEIHAADKFISPANRSRSSALYGTWIAP